MASTQTQFVKPGSSALGLPKVVAQSQSAPDGSKSLPESDSAKKLNLFEAAKGVGEATAHQTSALPSSEELRLNSSIIQGRQTVLSGSDAAAVVGGLSLDDLKDFLPANKDSSAGVVPFSAAVGGISSAAVMATVFGFVATDASMLTAISYTGGAGLAGAVLLGSCIFVLNKMGK